MSGFSQLYQHKLTHSIVDPPWKFQDNRLIESCSNWQINIADERQICITCDDDDVMLRRYYHGDVTSVGHQQFYWRESIVITLFHAYAWFQLNGMHIAP